jgi:hypothetical protein
MKRAMGFGGKSHGDEGGNNQLAMGAWDEEGKGGKVMATGIRVACDKEGKGNKEGNVVSNEGEVQQRERWLWLQEQWQQGWQVIHGNKGNNDGDGNNVDEGNVTRLVRATKRARARVAKAIAAMVTRVAGKQQ